MKSKTPSAEELIESLKESKSLERLLIDNADEALFFYSLEGVLIYVNPAFEKITGYTTQELYEKIFIPYVHPDDQEWTKKLWDGLFDGAFFEDVEYRIVKKSGEIRWCMSSWKIVCDRDGNKIGIQGKQQDITKRKLIEEELVLAKTIAEEMSKKDELTGLNNRREFFDQGKRIFKQAIRFDHSLSVMIMDIDHFKNINDKYGHAMGDKALKLIAQVLQRMMREIDIVARIGGEEFAFLLPETTLDKATNLAERLRLEIQNATLVEEEEPFQLTVSFGICSCPVNNETLETMLSKADKALYVAKNNGRNQIKTC